jgi:cytidine deaminase
MSIEIQEAAFALIFVRKARQAGHISKGQSSVLSAAINAAKNAYCVYSKFMVGAAVVTTLGDVYAGCNVENCMYNGMSHAELTAISHAIVHEGPEMKIQEMVIWTPTEKPTASCGGCRQLIREHAIPGAVVASFSMWPSKPPLILSLNELLPHSFGPENLL